MSQMVYNEQGVANTKNPLPLRSFRSFIYLPGGRSAENFQPFLSNSCGTAVDKKPLHVLGCFAVAGLLATDAKLSRWSSVANDVRWLQIAGALAAAAIVFLVTVLFRGNKVQRFLAAVLIVIPLIHLIGVFSEAIGYAFRW